MRYLSIIVLAAACGAGETATTQPDAEAFYGSDTLWECKVLAECASRTDGGTFRDTYQLCARPQPQDVTPGETAAQEWSAVWEAQCDEEQGAFTLIGHVCRDEEGEEPSRCEVRCTPAFQRCNP